MSASTQDPLAYYAAPGPFTDFGAFADQLGSLPTRIDELVQLVQSNLVHIFWAERYGLQPDESAQVTLNLRRVEDKLAHMAAQSSLPALAPRPLEQRQYGNCRDFTLLLVSLLRRQGVPARSRCGFGAYFMPNHYEDHWVAEYWRADQQRWVLVDAQLDAFQQSALQPDFDPLDTPRDRFIVAGQAWEMIRRGGADPAAFGILDMHGAWFVWGNVLRDFLAYNKVEILPWDWWGSPWWAHGLEDPILPDDQLGPYDALAALTLCGDACFAEIRATFENDPGLQPAFQLAPRTSTS